jgi:hypothetical protein
VNPLGSDEQIFGANKQIPPAEQSDQEAERNEQGSSPLRGRACFGQTALMSLPNKMEN